MAQVKKSARLLLLTALAGCGSNAPVFVSLGELPESSFFISVIRRDGLVDLTSASVFSNAAEHRSLLELGLETEDELFIFAFTEGALAGGLRARALPGDLSRVKLRAASGHSCGPGGNELSYDGVSVSMISRALGAFQPATLRLGPEDETLTLRDLGDEPDLAALEIELPADAEDCGIDPAFTLTPFTEGGVFDFPFPLHGETVAREVHVFAEILGMGELADGRYLLQGRRAAYVMARGTKFDETRDPAILIAELPLPQMGELVWEFRSMVVEPEPVAAGQRLFFLAFSTSPIAPDDLVDRHVAILQMDFDGTNFLNPMVVWFGDNVDFPETLLRDPFGGIVLGGRRGLAVFAPSWRGPFVEHRVGREDLRAVTVGEDPLYRHVFSERGGVLRFGDLGSGTPLFERNARASVTATHLAMGVGSSASIIYGGWRDGRIMDADLRTSEPFRELGFELSRRGLRCAGPGEGTCGRTTVSSEIGGLMVLGPPERDPVLLVLIVGCTHAFLFDPESGCTRTLGTGNPDLDHPLTRVLGRSNSQAWFGGVQGEIYSVP